MKPFANADVAAKFNTYPPNVQLRLLALRELIFQTAAMTQGVGEIEESLKWGEPAYLTKNKTGSTIRIDWKEKAPDQYAMYFNCKTNLVETFKTLFPNDFKFEGNRALALSLEGVPPVDSLVICIAASLTYHVKKRTAGGIPPSIKSTCVDMEDQTSYPKR
ncbi:DUF1801 domain-containing protein [Chitinibacter sp. ZOR0017]|uniref:DUF1801 domain-containing protein n=1 Tax=Chitinibacter sp. ZOR0017 TaxID=1339254 RepID=UPI0009DDFE9A|nr:DUF1801 domain-containing protein [Chitinibacter sp. ZOR0017]